MLLFHSGQGVSLGLVIFPECCQRSSRHCVIHQVPIRAGYGSSLSLLQSQFCLGRVSVTHTGNCSFKYSSTSSAWWGGIFVPVKASWTQVCLCSWLQAVKGKKSWICATGRVCVWDHREQHNLGCDFWFHVGDSTNTEHWAALSCGCFPFWHAKMQ